MGLGFKLGWMARKRRPGFSFIFQEAKKNHLIFIGETKYGTLGGSLYIRSYLERLLERFQS